MGLFDFAKDFSAGIGAKGLGTLTPPSKFTNTWWIIIREYLTSKCQWKMKKFV
jgi:hypothetical protein